MLRCYIVGTLYFLWVSIGSRLIFPGHRSTAGRRMMFLRHRYNWLGCWAAIGCAFARAGYSAHIDVTPPGFLGVLADTFYSRATPTYSTRVRARARLASLQQCSPTRKRPVALGCDAQSRHTSPRSGPAHSTAPLPFFPPLARLKRNSTRQ